MKRVTILAVGALMFAGTTAYADCAQELAALDGGVSKDGTMAPLSDTATPQTAPAEGAATAPEAGSGEGLTKDGTTEPLSTSPDVATSGQDAQAQQEGGMTAAEQAEGGGGGATDPKAEALERAKAALAAGDEEACMKAVEEAKGA